MRTIALMLAGTAATTLGAAELEVTHWWTSGGEAAAVAELAEAFNKTEHTWVDGAIAGSGGTARPIMVSRITGGDPMAATQFNHGQQAQEMVQAGLMRSLEDVAQAEGWRDFINPSSLLESCTFEGEIYCVPVNIHSQLWLWLSNDAFEQIGMDVPSDWNGLVEAAPKLREAGIQPLVLGQQGWQAGNLFQAILASVAGPEAYHASLGDKDIDVATGEEVTAAFKALGDAREMATGSSVQDWNLATNMVITGTAGAQVMGDWAQGEFAAAGKTAGEDYTCLAGLGLADIVSTGGDAFYFPVVDDEEITAGQDVLASTILSPETQVAFNLAKGSMPVRSDVDLDAANSCMRTGLDILENGTIVQGVDQLLSADAGAQLNELMIQFFADPDMSVDDAQERFVEILEFDDF